MNIQKVGIIGCGGFCQGTHLPNIDANPNLKIHALCDLNDTILAELNKKYSPEYVTADMDILFADSEIDFIVCGTKPDFRMPIMERAVASGKHLFVEKPLCYDPEEVIPMVELMKSSPIKFMVGFNRPYSPIMQDLKLYFEQYRKGNTTIIYRIVGEARLWPKHHYDKVVLEGESTILHEITHIFDLLNWLTRLYPEKVYTAGAHNMDNVITLTYPDNITAVIIAGDNSTAGYPKERIEINTGYTTIVGDHFIELNVYGADNKHTCKNYKYKLGKDKFVTSLNEARNKGWEWRSNLSKEQIEKGYYYDTQLYVDKGHYNELEIFRQWIVKDEPSESDVIQGAVANLTAWKAIESLVSGLPVTLDFSDII